MDMTLRFEIFPQDLDVIVDFYARVLGFSVTKDQRGDPDAYVALRRGAVHVGAARRAGPAVRAERRPPIGVELVLEVDDIAAERDRVIAAAWPLEGDLQDRPWACRTSGSSIPLATTCGLPAEHSYKRRLLVGRNEPS
jgi:lactoylglutathione lyase